MSSCDKVAYPTRQDAVSAIAGYVGRKKKGNHTNKQKSAYLCNACGNYHLMTPGKKHGRTKAKSTETRFTEEKSRDMHRNDEQLRIKNLTSKPL